MSVVGFDVGSQSCYIAIARHGGVEVVANEYSDRCSPSLVGFSEKMRCMGQSAKNQLVRKPKNTIYGFKNLIGQKFSDPLVQQERERVKYKVVEQTGDKIGIEVEHRGEMEVFSPEEITTMMLSYLKKVAESALNKPVTDCVVAVPSFFTDSQRRAMLDVVSATGLNCLRLMNETTAVALAYGIYKQDLPDEKEKARNVVFVDMGYSYLQVCVCAFHKGKLKVLSKSFDPSLGGRDFDLRLTQHVANDFKTRYKVDTFSRPRQTLRLLMESEKLKKLMSANTTEIPMNIECFMDDKDVTTRMKREQFENICSDLFQRMKAPLEDTLAKSGLKLSDVHAVEVVGGMSRMPAVKEVIKSVFKMELSTTLNQDEAVARGCALQCAMLSPTFKVRDFNIADTQPYPILLQWPNEGEKGEVVIFKEGDNIYSSKMLNFFRKEPFVIEACYQGQHKAIANPHIGKFKVKDIVPTEDGESSKIKVKARLSIHGIFFVKTASMVVRAKPTVEEETGGGEEKMETDSAPPQPSTTTSSSSTQTNSEEKGMESNPTPPEMDSQQSSSSSTTDIGTETSQQDASAAGTASTDQNMEEETRGEPANASGEKKTEQAEKSKEGEAKSNKSSEAKKPKKPTVKYVDLPIEEFTPSLSKHQLNLAVERESNLALQDKLEVEKANAKNAVEEYVYEMRDKLDFSLQEFISEAEKEKFTALLNATEEWLYDEGEDQPKKVYIARLEELKKMGDPVISRLKEFTDRPAILNELEKTVVHYQKILDTYDGGSEDYKHIAAEEMQKVRDSMATKFSWMNTQMQALSNLPKHADPPVKCSQIRIEKENLDAICKPIVTKPKPKVEPPKDEGEKDDKKPPATEGEGKGEEGEGKGEEEEGKGEEREGDSAQKKADQEEEMDLD